MINKDFYFISGLPRSGSTLLCSILNENKEFYATHTSPLLDLLYLNEVEWRQNPSVIANPIPEQIINISESIINGCWEHVPQNIIFDKHRAWGRNLPIIQQIFNKKPKVIITVRDIPSIIASFMRLLKESKQSPNYIDTILIERGKFLTDINRADLLWNNFIKDTWDSFNTAYQYDQSCLLLVDYDNLVSNPEHEINRVYDFLDLPKYNHTFNNIINDTVDNDLEAWGLEGLHTIRPELKKTCKPAIEVLGENIFNKYDNKLLEFWK